MAEASITAWRITQSRYLDSTGAAAGREAFSGDGARRYGGRWNPRGVPVAYTAGSQSLALLEVLVHLGALRLMRRYLVIPVTFTPDRVEDVGDLPDDWRDHPAPRSTQEIGAVWAAEARSPVLRVPSVIVPAESNYVVNPRHPDFRALDIGEPQAFDVDARLKG